MHRSCRGRLALPHERADRALVEALEPRLLLTAINVGEHVLLADTATLQSTPIYVTGTTNVEGLNLNVQVADGGPEAFGSIDGPVIDNVDILTGTIFASNHNPPTDLDGGPPPYPDIVPQFEGYTVTTQSGTLTANGLLATVWINTAGFASGTFDLKLSGTVNGDTDFAGGAADITNGHIILNRKPVADAGGAYGVPEGGSIALDGSGSYDPDAPADAIVLYAWDLDGDGVFGETGAAAARGDELGAHPTFSAAGLDGPTSASVALRVTDSYGFVCQTDAAATINVTNADPALSSVSATSPVNENGLATLSGTIGDAGAADTFSLVVDWGDGTSPETFLYPAGTTGFSETHRYLDDNPTGTPSDSYSISLTLHDDDGGSATAAAAVTVLNVSPVIGSLSATSVNENGLTHLTGTCSDVGTQDTHTLTINWGEGSGQTVPVSGGSFDVTHQYLDDNPSGTASDVYSISATLSDDDGGSDTRIATATVSNVAPTAAITGAPAGGLEGALISLGSSVSDPGTQDTFTYAWSVTKNGSLFASGSAPGFSFTPDDNGTYVVTLTVTDDDTGAGGDSKTITVTNVNPTLSGVSITSPINENGVASLTGTIGDAGGADTFSLVVDWGDGTTPQTFNYPAGTTGFSETHRYLDDNPTGTPSDSRPVSLTLHDDDGGTATASTSVTVNNVAPTAAITGAPAGSPEGTLISLDSSVSDPGTLDTFTYAWSVTKNGNSFAAGSAAGFSFTPDDNGTYVVTLTVTDDDTGAGGDSKTISVTNANPTISNVSATSPINENDTVTLSGTIGDPGSADTFSLTVNWGDGTTPQTFNYPAGTASFSETHQYLDDNPTGTSADSYPIGLTLHDDDGGTATASTSVTVNNTAATLSDVSATSPINENGTATLTGNITDPGTQDTFALTVDWGDGTTPQTFNYPAGTTGFSETHRYLDDNPTGTPSDNYQIGLTLHDDDGGTATASTSVTVNNVAPTAAITGAPAGSPEGTLISLGSSVSDPGTLDTFTYAWSVTKNGSAFAAGSAAGFSFTPDDNGTYVVTLTVTDDDTGVGSDSRTITVTNVAPVIGAIQATSTQENGVVHLTGTYSDVGTQDTHQLTINWGEATPQTVAVSGGSFDITHQYLDDNPTGTASDVYTISVTLRDDDGGTDTDSTTTTISNVAPVIGSVTVQARQNWQVEVPLSVTFSDVGTLDTFRASVNWGDGSPTERINRPAGSTSASWTHNYAEPAGAQAVYTITVTIEDDDTGTASDSTHEITLTRAEVVDRWVFYNNSAWDGNNPAANASDDAAIAPHTSVLEHGHADELTKQLGKDALLPGQTATFANYTSSSKGLNGIMVDIDGLANPGALSAADFQFKYGNSNAPDSWTAAQPPLSVTVRTGAGMSGSDRVTIIWADNDLDGAVEANEAVAKAWLQVTVLATDNTGLPASDVFYFGNAVGEGGNSATDAIVNATDEIGARSHQHFFLSPAAVYDPYDFNHDKKVDATDQIIARGNQSYFLTALKLIAVPAGVGGQSEIVMGAPAAPAEDQTQVPLGAYATASKVLAASAAFEPVLAWPQSETASQAMDRLLGRDSAETTVPELEIS